MHGTRLLRLDQLPALLFRQRTFQFQSIAENDLSGGLLLQSHLGQHAGQRNVMVLGRYPDPDVETAGQSSFQELMRAEAGIAAAFVHRRIAMALMLAVGKPGVKLGFLTEAGYQVALLALGSPKGKRSAFSSQLSAKTK